MGRVVLSFGSRGVRSEVTRPSNESSEAWPDVGGEVWCCEDELMTTAIRDPVRTRLGLACELGPAIARGVDAGEPGRDWARATRA